MIVRSSQNEKRDKLSALTLNMLSNLDEPSLLSGNFCLENHQQMNPNPNLNLPFGVSLLVKQTASLKMDEEDWDNTLCDCGSRLASHPRSSAAIGKVLAMRIGPLKLIITIISRLW